MFNNSKLSYLSIIIVIIVLLSGCSSLHPLPVREPPAVDDKGNRTTPNNQRGGLFPATNHQEAIDNLKIYSDFYQDESNRLRAKAYGASDTTLAGGIIGIIGGLASSPETAIAGGLLAGGSSIWSERYQFIVQSKNYEKASDSMYCMYRHLYPVNSGMIPINYINERIYEVRRKLRKAQSSVELISPDLGELEQKLSTLASKKKEKEDTEKQLNNGAVGITVSQLQQRLIVQEIEILKGELSKCTVEL